MQKKRLLFKKREGCGAWQTGAKNDDIFTREIGARIHSSTHRTH